MVEPRHRKSIYHFQQLFFDQREWDLASWSWTTLQPQREAESDTSTPVTISSLRWWVRLGTPLSLLAGTPLLGRFLSIKRLVNAPLLLKALYKIQAATASIAFAGGRTSKDTLYNKIARLHSRMDCGSVHAAECGRCAAKPICNGVYREYERLFGAGEVRAIDGPRIKDPAHYIRQQHKIIEVEDDPFFHPVEPIVIKCPGCSHIFEEWYRRSANSDLDDFDEEYLDKCSSAVCPRCKYKVFLGSLVVEDGIFFVRGSETN
jgi:hypothetical protein